MVPFVPLAWLPLQASYLVWAVAQLGLLAWLMWRLWTVVAADWSRDERLVLVAASLAASPLLITFLQGAFSLLVCVAVTEAYIGLRARRDGRAGAWLALASIKPQAVVTLGVMLFVGRRWRAIAAGAVVGLVLAAVATVVLGPRIWTDYLGFLSRYVSTFDEFSVRPSVMWNIRGTLTLLIGPDQAAGQATLINTVGLVGQLAGLAAVAWLWRGRWDPTSVDFDLRFALTLVIGLLTSPHLNPHDDLLLVPAAAIAYRGLRQRADGGWIGLALALSPLVILLTNSISANDIEGPPVRIPVVLMTGVRDRPGPRDPRQRNASGSLNRPDPHRGALARTAQQRQARRTDREPADPQDGQRQGRGERDGPAPVGQGTPAHDHQGHRQPDQQRQGDLELRDGPTFRGAGQEAEPFLPEVQVQDQRNGHDGAGDARARWPATAIRAGRRTTPARSPA